MNQDELIEQARILLGKPTKKKKVLRIVALVNGFAGVVILASVVLPIIAYNLGTVSSKSDFVSPIPTGNSVYAVPDYTKASNWFVGGREVDFTSQNVKYYTLSIPKLRIKDATVAIGGENLDESLIQYPGTAVPGKRGNAVIFGHSILPQFYDPKNYLSIFSTLPTLEEGDEIQVSYDGVNYRYRVEDLFEVRPTDIEILEQNVSDSFLTLVTCVPPGHPLKPKRLIVRARVVPLTTQNNYEVTRN